MRQEGPEGELLRLHWSILDTVFTLIRSWNLTYVSYATDQTSQLGVSRKSVFFYLFQSGRTVQPPGM